MDNQNQNPVTPQNDLPISEIVSALKSAPPAPRSEADLEVLRNPAYSRGTESTPAGQPPVSPLQEITPAPMPTPVSPVVSPAPTAPSAPTVTPLNPLAENPDQVVSPGSK